jgi:hypothetical protein
MQYDDESECGSYLFILILSNTFLNKLKFVKANTIERHDADSSVSLML